MSTSEKTASSTSPFALRNTTATFYDSTFLTTLVPPLNKTTVASFQTAFISNKTSPSTTTSNFQRGFNIFLNLNIHLTGFFNISNLK